MKHLLIYIILNQKFKISFINYNIILNIQLWGWGWELEIGPQSPRKKYLKIIEN